MKKKLIKGIVIFGVLMVIFTIISRVVIQMCTPNVVVTEAKEGIISTRMEVEGSVKGKQETAMISNAGLQIEAVYVEEGAYIKKEDVLYQYNSGQLKKSINNLKDEVEILKLQITETEENIEIQKQQDELAYNNAVYNYELVQKQYQNQVDEAWQACELVKSNPDSSKEEKDSAQRAYEAVVLQQQAALAQALNQLNSTQIESTESTVAQQSYILKSQKEEEIKELEELLEREGKVYAKIEGQVTKVYIEPGSITTGTADMLIVNEAGGKVVEFTLDDSGEELVSVDDIIVGNTVQISDSDDSFQECEVIGKQQEEGGAWKFVVDVSDLKAGINENVIIQIQNIVNQYQYVIPREALHQGEGNKYFVYVAEEKETVLGTEYRARHQEVEVLEMNSWEAAIENISFTQRIVTDSDKPLSDSCRISYIVEE